MDINKFINTNYKGKDIQNITGLTLNAEILTNVIYKIKQNIKIINNFEQLYSNVEIIINDMDIKNKKITINKINQFLYNQLYIDINIADLRKNISEHFVDVNTCTPTVTTCTPTKGYRAGYFNPNNGALADIEDFTIENDIIENFQSGKSKLNSSRIKLNPGNAWYSASDVNNNTTSTIDTLKCPHGLSLEKKTDGTNICTTTIEDILFETKINNYVENKWYEWFTIPNFHLDNKFKEITEDNITVRLQPCGYNNDTNVIEFDKVPYTQFIDKCMNKID